MSGKLDEHRPIRPAKLARLLLLTPFFACLWVSSYNTVEPMVAGIPFFYWYQLMWVALSAIIIAIVYCVER